MKDDLNINQSKDEIWMNAEDIKKEVFCLPTNDNSIKIENVHLDYKETMWQICKMWIEECAKEDRYPFDVLIPVPFSDIKDSEREGYMEIIMEKFRKEKKKNKG